MLRYNEDDFYYKLIKMLLDAAASEAEFDAIIKNIPFNEKKWQTYLISSPSCFNYCQQKLITFKSKEEIYLLKHSRMNHHHAELRTYYLYKEWIKKEFEEKSFLPFNDCAYWDPANGSEKPCAYLDGFIYCGFTYALDILYSNSTFELRFFSRDSEKKASDLLCEINSMVVLNMEFRKKGKDHDRDQLFSSGYKTLKEIQERIMGICGSLKRLNSK
jgi:hypothetical protein